MKASSECTYNDSINIMVIGAGKIARAHLDVLSAMHGINIKAICSRSGKGLKEIADEYGIERVSDNWEKILSEEHIDAVWILVSHEATYGITKKCLEAGVPCFIEKPAGMNLSEAADLAALAEKHNVLNMVALNRRFYSSVNKAVAEIELRGPLMGVEIKAPEPIRRKRSESRLDSTVYDMWLTANSIHLLDLFLYIGGEPEEVFIAKKTYEEPLVDNFHLSARFKKGTLGSFIAHWLSPGSPFMVLYGNGLRIEFPSLEKAVAYFENGSSRVIDSDDIDKKFKAGFFRQAKVFIDALKNGEKEVYPGCSLAESAAVMALIQRIYEK